MHVPDLDISVVTFDSQRWLDAFFRSLLEQNYPLGRIGLLLRDNGSSDQTQEKLRAFVQEHGGRFRCVEFSCGTNIGFGRGHNANLAKESAPYFLVTNVDLEFEAGTLTTLLDIACADPEDFASWECRQKPYEHPKNYHPVSQETLWSSSACVLFRRSAIEQVGGYEPRLFMYGEDVELSYRLRDHGFRLRYVPKATVRHYSYEDPGKAKPLQFYESTLANVLLRCRYGSLREVLQGFIMFLGLFLVPARYPAQRRELANRLVRLVRLAPQFLLTRKKSREPFPFRMWDYLMVRDGAFHPYPAAQLENPPLISVVMRTMPGCGGRLSEAARSVMQQTYSPIELVVVEDGGETARDQVEQIRASGVLHAVRYVSLPKSGRCVAGNAGLAAATGDLLCFLDDDDLFYADHLEVLATSLMQEPQLGGVYGLAFEVRTNVISQDPWRYQDLVYSVIHRQAFNRTLVWHHNFMPIQTVLFRRELYDRLGGFDTGLENLEDWNLWVRYTLERDFMLVPKLTSLYRVPANPDKVRERQDVLDRYYAIAQAKHATLSVSMSPPQVLAAAEQLARELYVVAVPVRSLRSPVLGLPVLRWFYYPARRLKALWRAARQG